MDLENAVKVIDQSNLLTENEIKSILEMRDELEETFAKSQVFRTRTEMEISVLNDLHFPTPAAKYWQAVREQQVHFTELVELSYDYRKKVIEIKKLERKLEQEKDELEREIIKIEIEREKFHLRQMEKVAKDRLREVREWSDIKKRESKKMTKEELEDVNNHQLISYTKRFIKEALVINEQTPTAEKMNILGHLYNGLKECKEKGIIDKVIDDLYDAQKQLIYTFMKNNNLLES